MMWMKSLYLAIAMTILFAGGASSAPDGAKITSDDLLRGDPIGASKQPSSAVKVDDFLAVSDEMRQFVKQHVNRGAIDVFKMQQLMDAIIESRDFGLEYEENTRTAAETFRVRRGNCLSFASMFVSLAREVGINATFQEVDIAPDWSMRKDVFVLNRHINVSVDLGSGGVHVVDFNISDFKSTYETHLVSDRRATAHFYNNLGVERMQEDNPGDALAFYRLAINRGDGAFSPPWTNLGSLYRKVGLFDFAEAAFLQALKVDKKDEVAMSNLVSLYERVGAPDKAEEYRKRVDEHRLRNPYYRFYLAREAFFERDFDTAVAHLKHAIRVHKHDDEFYFLLGLCYLMKGDEKEARKFTDKAEEVAATDEQKRRYSTKIETLLSASEKVD